MEAQQNIKLVNPAFGLWQQAEEEVRVAVCGLQRQTTPAEVVQLLAQMVARF